jgi:hypothetical protein
MDRRRRFFRQVWHQSYLGLDTFGNRNPTSHAASTTRGWDRVSTCRRQRLPDACRISISPFQLCCHLHPNNSLITEGVIRRSRTCSTILSSNGLADVQRASPLIQYSVRVVSNCFHKFTEYSRDFSELCDISGASLNRPGYKAHLGWLAFSWFAKLQTNSILNFELRLGICVHCLRAHYPPRHGSRNMARHIYVSPLWKIQNLLLATFSCSDIVCCGMLVELLLEGPLRSLPGRRMISRHSR